MFGRDCQGVQLYYHNIQAKTQHPSLFIIIPLYKKKDEKKPLDHLSKNLMGNGQTLLHSRMWHIQVNVIVNMNFDYGAVIFRG